MSILVYKTRVLDYGDIQETEEYWMGSRITYKKGFESAKVIPVTPPYDSEWRYVDGELVDHSKSLNEAQDRLDFVESERQRLLLENESSLVRAERNKRLTESDWTQVLDAPVDKIKWASYRDELRNVPQQDSFPWEVQWPEKPE
jgi:hypothetical protein